MHRVTNMEECWHSDSWPCWPVFDLLYDHLICELSHRFSKKKQKVNIMQGYLVHANLEFFFN